MQMPTSSQIYSFSRHVITFAMGGVTVGVALHVVSPDQGTDATTAINQIVDGSKLLIAGATTLIGLASGLYAAWTASPLSQLASVARNPEVKTIVTTPAVAAATPSEKVIAQ